MKTNRLIPFPIATPADADNGKRWAYLRISLSTEMQANSLAVQRAQIEAHCERHGLTLVGVTTDEDSSATEIDFFDRPRVQAMLRDMPEDCRHLVVTKLDRLSRSRAEVGMMTMRTLDEFGFALTVFDAPFDTSTAAGRLQLTVMLAVSCFETQRRKERQLEAFGNMRTQHRRTGSVPYGWDAAPSTRTSKTKRAADDLAPNWKEQAILRDILRWHGEGKTDCQIASLLRQAGHPTKKDGQVHNIWKDSQIVGTRTVKGKWHSATVQSVREHAILADTQPAALAA